MTPDEPVLLLSIGADETSISLGPVENSALLHTLSLGDQQLVRDQFGNRFPGESQLENAITVVEDEVMKSWPLPPGATQLTVVDPILFGLALASGFSAGPGIDLDLEAVERIFSRLAAVSQGSPASHQGIPDDAALAARLVIVREFLHHQRLQSVRVHGAT